MTLPKQTFPLPADPLDPPSSVRRIEGLSIFYASMMEGLLHVVLHEHGWSCTEVAHWSWLQNLEREASLQHTSSISSVSSFYRVYHLRNILSMFPLFTRDTCPRQIVKEPLSSSAFLRANIRLTDRCTFRSRFWLLHMRNFFDMCCFVIFADISVLCVLV
ncbi:hypothetical protein D6C77_06241 [Aureobasidium pullulans]|uniref:Uncharacterized protein n=1 Tax=Aureobasidium pullulans TaxID=5580 RepID=A0A4T0AC43_AURPU|nr:hypothetical protein D6D28_08039 [Aureobasidium pullulans]THV96477.1 hypothetical protein D6D27_02660 [Aureobasidium pullulans]THV97429.1 hypothetical protein D6D26_06709 [Aureobasidium pullulans]THX36415.1 hypothetical protein D6D10_06682 [Aureobasidium pullulans]THY85914.1 hypothetical protein D6C93_08055 [Aureobasidium pullulans]